jgi:hypothetical protein
VVFHLTETFGTSAIVCCVLTDVCFQLLFYRKGEKLLGLSTVLSNDTESDAIAAMPFFHSIDDLEA